MFYEQLLHAQVPKEQKDTDDMNVYFALLGSLRIKAVHKHVGELILGLCVKK